MVRVLGTDVVDALHDEAAEALGASVEPFVAHGRHLQRIEGDRLVLGVALPGAGDRLIPVLLLGGSRVAAGLAMEDFGLLPVVIASAPRCRVVPERIVLLGRIDPRVAVGFGPLLLVDGRVPGARLGAPAGVPAGGRGRRLRQVLVLFVRELDPAGNEMTFSRTDFDPVELAPSIRVTSWNAIALVTRSYSGWRSPKRVARRISRSRYWSSSLFAYVCFPFRYA